MNQPQVTESIIIDATKSEHRQLLQGFLLGFGDRGIPNPELVAQLKPKFWRTGDSSNNLKQYQTIKQFNPKITWETSTGYYKLKGTWYNECGPNFQGCTPEQCRTKFPPQPWLDGFTEYKQYIKNYVKAAIVNNLSIHYWDFWSEPDNYGRFGTQEQMFATFKAFHDAVREVERETGVPQKIVAPSISNLEGKDSDDTNDCNLPQKPADQRVFKLEDFLKFIADNNLRLDAISWHEWAEPEKVPKKIGIIRNYMQQLGLCNPNCPEIHINEYQGSEQSLLPGNTVGWLYYLEKANVTWASRSCWKVGDVDGCWGGLNGMFMGDTKTPQAQYWLHHAYAGMDGKLRLETTSSDSHTIALASRDDTNKEIRVIVGRYCHAGNRDWWSCYYPTLRREPSATVDIVINNYIYGSDAEVEVYHIPHSKNVPAPLIQPELVSSKTILVNNTQLKIQIPNFEDEDAYSIVIIRAL